MSIPSSGAKWQKDREIEKAIGSTDPLETTAPPISMDIFPFSEFWVPMGPIAAMLPSHQDCLGNGA